MRAERQWDGSHDIYVDENYVGNGRFKKWGKPTELVSQRALRRALRRGGLL